MRPAGMRPAGMRPAGMRPAGMRPAGMRPAGMRPAGMRPAGMRPVGMRPAGMRPVGMRPAGMRPYEDAAEPVTSMPSEWSADVACLFCEYSAVMRLGATLSFGLSELPYPSPPVLGTPRYLPEPRLGESMDDKADSATATKIAAAVADVSKETATQLSYRRLKPRSHELTIQIAVRNRLVRSIVEHPEVAWTLKQDIAAALAFRADQGFLYGDAAEHGPRGIACIDPALDRRPATTHWRQPARWSLSFGSGQDGSAIRAG